MALPQSNTLPKRERLYCKKDISNLLAKGRYASSGPLRYCYVDNEGLGYSRILVSVPKKNFKRAVKRNLLKRRVREAWRLGKSAMGGRTFDIMFTYTSKEISSSEAISAAVGNVICILSTLEK
ncbi:MAG: ribonuclease P protein component [Bacteroidales bacterium]|nr:ribonuclease P protein component [Bacteroidales bacterium]